MTAQVPEVAQRLASELADAFEADRGLAERLTAAQHRLQAANGRLWSGLHPDALGLVYDDPAAVGQGSSAVAEGVVDAMRADAQRPRSKRRCWASCRRSTGRSTAPSPSTSALARTAATWPPRSAS